MAQLDDNTLAAYVDGELDAATAEEIACLLERDAAAQDKVRKLTQSAVLIRAAHSALVHEPAPERLLALVEGPARRSWRLRLAAAALAAGLTVGLAGGVLLGRFEAGEEVQVAAASGLLEEIAAYHVVYAREREHLVEIPAARTAELERWLNERLGRRIEVPDLSARGLEFRGGRLLVADGRPVGQLMYTAPGRAPVAICITTGSGERQEVGVLHSRGLTLLSWQSGGYVYVLVGEVGEAALRDLAGELAPRLERT